MKSLFSNGINKHRNNIIRSIKRHGMYVKHDADVSYTVGLSSFGLPELALFGMPEAQSEEIFYTIYSAIESGQIKENNFEALGDLFVPLPFLSEINSEDVKKIFYSAYLYFGEWNFKAVKLGIE